MKSDSSPITMNDSKKSGIKRVVKKLLIGLISLVFLFSGLFIYGKYFYTYSDGYRTGFLQKFSHKGELIKTYEGEMVLSNITATGKQVVMVSSEKFYFTVTDRNLANQLDTIQGQMVIVHYQQKNGALFWNGDSPFIVDGVKQKP